MSDDHLSIEGIAVRSTSTEESLQEVLQSKAQLTVVAWLNAHCVNVARTDGEYRRALSRVDLLMNDGIGLQLAARLQGHVFRENLNGTDWIPRFLTHIEPLIERPRSVFLLGATEETLARAIELIQRRWPGLSIVGAQHGFFDADESVLERIRDLRPEVLLVAMGVPRQELFIDRNRAALQASGVRVAVAGGAILDFIAEAVPRAPRWVRVLNAEWVWRLGHEPERLWKRYIVGNPLFLFHAYRHSRELKRRGAD